ncbi:MAG TPA: glycosyltransferase family 4 protein [Gemmatimonadaceae bacterium]|nr:glycosyltransferase family 4 protein [Gemmatimonadaceae bacterium]
MRVLFYVGDKRWSGSSRAVLSAARGLVARGHFVTVACCADSRLDELARAAEIETVPVNADASAAGGAWDLRKVIQSKFIEVAVVTSERDQLIVSSARLFADRGAVLRRVPCFDSLELQRGGKLALRLAASGLIITTQRELDELPRAGWALPPAIVPLGVDVAAYDELEPVSRALLEAPSEGMIIACHYDESGRYRIATVFRTLALLAPRHRNMHVVVFGPGSLDEELKMHASALGVGALVSFVGDAPDELDVMRAAEAGWIVSGGDTAAYACLDFMAMRIPVIADKSPLTQHFVADAITGTLLPPAEPANIASSVAAFLASRERMAAMGNAARTRVQREFTESAMIDAFERAVNAGGDRSQWSKR